MGHYAGEMGYDPYRKERERREQFERPLYEKIQDLPLASFPVRILPALLRLIASCDGFEGELYNSTGSKRPTDQDLQAINEFLGAGESSNG